MSAFGRMPACTDAETYGTCAGGGGRQYNLDGLLDVERYMNSDLNPYVVGSAAYAEAHGLPHSGMSWAERLTAPAGASASAGLELAAANLPSGAGANQAASSNLPWALIAVAALIWIAS